MIGRQIGQYRVVAKLGEGGMGQVFSAHDEKLKRTVALKWISSDRLENARARTMFLREARAAASLDHPFICSVHEVLDDDGQPVIVMERVEGQTLGDRVVRGPLPEAELRTLAIEIAEALASAHARGIVHRDVKSANIMLTEGGHVKVMDFGLATITSAEPEEETARRSKSELGLVGTLAYIAPEVLRGRPATSSSDLYAFGVVLYEMATGRRPFSAASQADLIADILSEKPRPPRQINKALSADLEALILALLAKDPSQRPRSAGEVIETLRQTRPQRQQSPRRSIAVLPFQPLTHDAESAHLGLGLADATTAELAMVHSLLVRPTAAILRYDDRTVDPVQAGHELNVDAVVAGTFQRAGQRVRVTVQLIDVAEERPLWSVKIDDTLTDIFALQDQVSRKIVEALQVQLTPADERRIGARVQPAGQAVEAWMKGRVALLHDNLENVRRAVDSFSAIRDLDPQNPLGWVGLADAYERLAFSYEPDRGWYARAKAMLDQAARLAPTLPEVRYVRARLAWSPDGRWDHDLAIRELTATIAERPNMNEAFDWLGTVLLHVGLVEEARNTLEQAETIHPDDELALSHLPFVEQILGNYEAAATLSLRRIEAAPTSWSYYVRAHALIHDGDLAAVERTIDEGATRFPESVLLPAFRAVIAAKRGDHATALATIDWTEKNRKAFGHFHHAEMDIAAAYAQIGRLDDAMTHLIIAADDGFPCLAAVENDSLLDPVRAHSGYEAHTARLRALREHYLAQRQV